MSAYAAQLRKERVRGVSIFQRKVRQQIAAACLAVADDTLRRRYQGDVVRAQLAQALAEDHWSALLRHDSQTVITGGTFRLDVHTVLADDEHSAALLTQHATRNGRSITTNVVHVGHLRDGRTSEFWAAFTDPAAIVDFWA